MKILENFKYGENEQQILDVHIPEGLKEFPLFINFHGGGLERGSHDESFERFVPDLCKKGVAVVTATYRKYPNAKYPEFIEDGASVVKWAYDNIPNYGKINGFFIGGTSAGGYISMMLCFDPKYLNKHGLSNDIVTGYYFNTGQATTHINVLKERGFDRKRLVVDEAGPIYHINPDIKYPPMEFTLTSNDRPLRYEEHDLLKAVMKNQGHDMNKVTFAVAEGEKHSAYTNYTDENGNYIYAQMIYDFIIRILNKE